MLYTTCFFSFFYCLCVHRQHRYLSFVAKNENIDNVPKRWSIRTSRIQRIYLLFEYIRSEIIMMILGLLLLSSNQPNRERENRYIYNIYEWAQFAMLLHV